MTTVLGELPQLALPHSEHRVTPVVGFWRTPGPVRVVELADTQTAAHVLVRLDAGGNPLLARITRYSRDQLHLHPGHLLWAQIKSVAVLA